MTKPQHHLPYSELAALPMLSYLWEEISMDMIVDLPRYKLGNRVYDSILVIVNRLIKTSIYIPITKKLTNSMLADLFLEKVFVNYSIPKGIILDRGSIFTSGF